MPLNDHDMKQFNKTY